MPHKVISTAYFINAWTDRPGTLYIYHYTWAHFNSIHHISLPSVIPTLQHFKLLRQNLNIARTPHETLYVYDDTWAHLNGTLPKSLRSVILWRARVNSQLWKRLLATVAKRRTDKHATMGSPYNSRGILGGVLFGVRFPAIWLIAVGATRFRPVPYIVQYLHQWYPPNTWC
jgi:hypothetical protein